ncbi:MAG TPA: BlaI/MecI/CopY family transcriptional regulator [Vicinamibacteria bacterium]|nr:BlaI/MecI/CopY family transcriptional regulator [Vicinamibacteria bacterium]
MRNSSPRPHRNPAPGLGPLEQQVMDHLWDAGRALRVSEVHAAFGTSFAYTTLMTTLDRLNKKGLLDRTRDGRAFRYVPRLSREALHRRWARHALELLLGRGAQEARPVLSTLVEAVGERDAAMLDDLERLVAEERRRALHRAKP